MTEPWTTYTPEMNAFRMEAGTGPETYMAAATALSALAASFEIQQGVLLAHAGVMATLWPGLTVAARQAKVTAYSAWLDTMMAECARLAAACVVIAEAYTSARAGIIPSAACVQNRISQAAAVATNFCGINQPLITFLDTTYVEHWTQNATAMTTYDAQVITASAPVPKMPPPPLVNPAEPALDAAQQAVGDMAQNAAGSITNQGTDASQFMQPLQEAMSAPQQLVGQTGQLMQPFQQALSAPEQMMGQFMSGLNGMSSGGMGADNLSYSPLAAMGGAGVAPTLSGASSGGAFASGGVGGLRPALAAPTGGLSTMSSTQSLSAGARSVVPASSSPMNGMGSGGLGGAGMRGKEEQSSRQPVAIEAGVAPIADTDSVRANEILATWLPKRAGGLH
ncbi:PPE domain-containing protein [Mycobacterium intracellulare]|uniref:PPE family protein n=1 Tax=Mycobacterium intracellulare subsp. chimaera TaxID=222805 RepID=A0A7U5MRI5_MYCIT|nr:PPE domain-containing protein [Mycobacterium intracellulare]ASL18389.1 PPE family protein [Mycobacterium intracellulare subsp. chimaera]